LRLTSIESATSAPATRASQSEAMTVFTRSVLSTGAGRNTMSKLGELSARMRPLRSRIAPRGARMTSRRTRFWSASRESSSWRST